MDEYDNIYSQEDEYYQYQYDHDYHADSSSNQDYEDYRYSNSKPSNVNNDAQNEAKKANTEEKSFAAKAFIFFFSGISVLFILFCFISIIVGVFSGDW